MSRDSRENNQTKIVFFGTSDFAVPALTALLRHGYDIASVITNPDEPKGRKQIITPPPVKVLAEKHGLLILQPEKIKENKEIIELLSDTKPDIAIVAAYGKIIPKEIIDLPRHGTLNLHPSLLPRWRGPSPIQYTIIFGDTETGVTIIKLDELMDHGQILAQRELGISKARYSELHDTLAKLGAELLIEVLPKYISEEIVLIPQDDNAATYSKILKKDDGRIDWSRPAEEIERKVRALNPWPGTWTIWPSGEKIYRIRIEDADVTQEINPQGSSGYISLDKNGGLQVKTGHGSLEIKKLTLEGKKTLDTKNFIRGYPTLVGATFV